ncbi:MFS transporter [Streptomyces sp. NPDC020472]|uniref:MFS transporter n=1 Tax=Streptomyces sp. NPDC020472 TaxID=3365075 RepID=UPI00378814E7
MTAAAPSPQAAPAVGMWPLYTAGLTTAFGAHGIAAGIGGFSDDAVTSLFSLFVLGGLLALYDGAEVLLKPVFGSLADRIGAKPVLVGGLLAFAASTRYVVADSPGWLWGARLGQGAAASALVARLNPAAKHGRAFGSYGFYKSIGYTLGPLLGGILVWAGGLRPLFTVLAVLGAAVAVWAGLAVPLVSPLPKARQTVLDLARRLADPVFLARRPRSPRPLRRCRSASGSCQSRVAPLGWAPWRPGRQCRCSPAVRLSSSRGPDALWMTAVSPPGRPGCGTVAHRRGSGLRDAAGADRHPLRGGADRRRTRRCGRAALLVSRLRWR